MNCDITTEVARAVCSHNTAPQLIQHVSKAQLREMYIALYGREPQRYRIEDMAYACKNFVEDEKRTADLCKILR